VCIIWVLPVRNSPNISEGWWRGREGEREEYLRRETRDLKRIMGRQRHTEGQSEGKEKERARGVELDRQTDRQTDRERERIVSGYCMHSELLSLPNVRH
jgi:hypothetical protein